MEKVLIQTKFDKSTIEKIDKLKIMLGNDNPSNIVSDSIKIYYELITILENGDEIFIKRKNGKKQKVNLVDC
jgi:hypothetical protein